MAKIKLSKGGFTPIPKGEHVFKITKSTYDEDFGKVEIDMVTVDGKKHTERFSLIRNDGEINEGALNAFSYFAKTALNNFNVEEIDPADLEGCYMRCVVDHEVQPNKNDPSKTVTFVRLGEKYAASGFDQEAETPRENKSTGSTGGFDLDSILG